MSANVTDVLIYPVKSCAAISLSSSTIGPEGMIFDRCWQVVNADGHTLTQRECPRMALLQTAFRGSTLEISFNERADCLLVPTLVVPGQHGLIALSKTRSGFDVGDGAAHWLSTILGVSCRLQRVVRNSESVELSADERVAERLATGYPLLVISQPSLRDLNTRLEQGVLMNRFRPNLVVDGCMPYDEESWKRIRIGDVNLVASDKCGRCTLILVDQETGQPSGKEPLRELAKYRRIKNGEKNEVIFGQYFVPEEPGVIFKGDPVTVL